MTTRTMTGVVSSDYELLPTLTPYSGGVATFAFVGVDFVGDWRDDYLTHVASTDSQATMRDAAAAVSSASGLSFVEVEPSSGADILVGFSDTLGYGTLGAFYWQTHGAPGGVIALDAGTSWSGEKLHDVFVHELLHAAGLDHPLPGNPPTLMETPYAGEDGVFDTLTADDIAGLQALYGAPGGGTPAPPTPAPTPAPTPSPAPVTPVTPVPHPVTPPAPEPAGGGEFIVGTPGYDRLYGTDGDDVMVGGAGRDLLAGGDGDDFLVGGYEGATLFGQAGADTFVFVGGNNWYLDFNPHEGDKVAGFDAAYLADAHQMQVNEHRAVWWGGDNPWHEDADTIWLANNGLTLGEWALA